MRVLKNKHIQPPPRAQRGSGILIVSIVTAIIVAMTSFSITKLHQASYNGLNSSMITMQAQQYGMSEAEIVTAMNYDDLTAHGKTQIQNSDGYFSELLLSTESSVSDDIKQRDVLIKVYKGDEILPRYSLNVRRTSAKTAVTGGVPVGTVIAWLSTTAPTEGGTWLLCNGQSCTSYPKLKALIGNNVPDLNARFLEGTTCNPRLFKDAGLPNITGTIRIFTGWEGDEEPVGCFYFSRERGNQSPSRDNYRSPDLTLDASRSSSVYGKSTTVQPAAYTVRYYIKAA